MSEIAGMIGRDYILLFSHCALISAIAKSPLLYQYMQADILKVIQSKLSPVFAEEFMAQAKQGIKDVIDVLQKNRLI